MPALALLLLALGAPSYAGTVGEAKKASEAAAQSFLGLVDAGKVDETWSAASALVKKTLTREQWRLTTEAARAGTGRVERRAHDRSQFTEVLPNLPQAAYVLVDYRGKFEKQQQVRERVVIVYEDGTWRVCGYWMNYDPENAAQQTAKP